MKTFKITGSLILAILMSLSFVSCDDDDDDDKDLLEGLWVLTDASYFEDSDDDEEGLGGTEYYFNDNRFEMRISEYDGDMLQSSGRFIGKYSENDGILSLIAERLEAEDYQNYELSAKTTSEYADGIETKITISYKDDVIVGRDTTVSPSTDNTSLSKIEKLTKEELILISGKDTLWLKRK